MEIKQVKLGDITPYKNNSKKHDKTQIANVAESIKQFGFVQPIVLSADNTIVIGHCRYLAAKKLGMDSVPCYYVEDLTEEQIRKLRNLDNKLNESEWDLDLLSLDIDGLDFSGFDVDWGIISPDDYGEDFSLPDGDKAPYKQVTFTLSNEQAEFIDDCISRAKSDNIIDDYDNYGNTNNNGNALYAIIREWEKQKI